MATATYSRAKQDQKYRDESRSMTESQPRSSVYVVSTERPNEAKILEAEESWFTTENITSALYILLLVLLIIAVVIYICVIIKNYSSASADSYDTQCAYVSRGSYMV